MPILQLHIEPLVWRRIQLPGDCTFRDLHVAIQGAFAWRDTHAHEFRSGQLRFGRASSDCWPIAGNARATPAHMDRMRGRQPTRP